MELPPKTNHGFSLLGERSLVLSHIPMFMAPHQFQIFLDVTIDEDAATAYLQDKRSGSTDYILVSDPIVLPTLDPHSPYPLTELTGKLYRGWPFNNPNTAPVVAPALKAQVKRVVHFRSILDQPLLKDLTYLAFHTAETTYLVHELVQPADLTKAPKPPDFVHILSGKLGDTKAHDAVEVVFSGVANDAEHRLKAGQEPCGTIGGKQEKVHVAAELIFDPNHLVM
jgi:hypothetical protein